MGDVALVEKCFAEGANIENKNEDRWLALTCAKEEEHPEVLSVLVNRIEDTNKKFVAASYVGNVAEVSKCLAKGARIDYIDGYWTAIAMSRSAREGNEAVVALLVDNGYPVDGKDYFGETGLMYAAEGGHENVAKVLLDRGATL